jgi:hypothetical protein
MHAFNYVVLVAGFYNYLMMGRGGCKSKYEQIRQHLNLLLEKYPNYTISVSGHSLGAALATLFTFHLATDDHIPKPITVITFASPRVGNIRLSRAFQELEMHRKIRHLRVANDEDVVTRMPDGLRWSSFCCSERIYRDIGISLNLYHAGKPRASELIVPHVYLSRSALVLHDMRVSTNVSSLLMRYHGPIARCLTKRTLKHIAMNSCSMSLNT